MNPPKAPAKSTHGSSPPLDGKTLSTGESSQPSTSTSSRKAWKPRTPVEVVFDQIQKQEKKVAELEKDLEREKASLNKLLQAKRVLES